MRKPESTLTTQELAIMKVVWRLGHVTVRDVYHALLESRHIAYTTVMTMMNVLETKGHLKKDTLRERFQRFSPRGLRDGERKPDLTTGEDRGRATEVWRAICLDSAPSSAKIATAGIRALHGSFGGSR